MDKPRSVSTYVACPIVYGSIAFPLGKKSEFATHKWTFYVRGPNNEDLSGKYNLLIILILM